MNILYIAYSCSPNRGSEARIGWKIPIECAKKHKVTVITKKEHENEIREHLNNNPVDIDFYFVDIPQKYKMLFDDFFYLGRLHIWQNYALKKVRELCEKEKYDVIHQIAPVEFRSVADCGRIRDVKFICGPLGGGEYIPKGLSRYAIRYTYAEVIRCIINRLGMIKLKHKGVFEKSHVVMFANAETKKYMNKVVPNQKSINGFISEIAIDENETAIRSKTESDFEGKRIFLVSGRLVYRKGHAFLLKAFSEIPEELDYECYFAGEGKEMKRLKKMCRKYGLEEKVHFLGGVPFEEMQKVYKKSQVLIMPSIRETTGSVLLEAMAKGMPVITIGRFGGMHFLNDNNSWLYDGNTHRELLNNLKCSVIECIQNNRKTAEKSHGALLTAKNNTWEKKFCFYEAIYKKALLKK